MRTHSAMCTVPGLSEILQARPAVQLVSVLSAWTLWYEEAGDWREDLCRAGTDTKVLI